MNIIGGFLGNDSTFGRLMTKVGTIIAANVLFAVCSIPVVTIGAAWKGLYHTMFSMIEAEDAINPFKTFWQGFRKNFVRTTLYWLAFAAVMILGYIDLQVCMQVSGGIQYFSAGVIAVMIVLLVIAIYLFPLLSIYTGRLTEMLQKALFFAMNRPLKLVVILLLHVVPAALYCLDEVNRPTYAFIGAFFGFGVIALITAKLMVSQIRKYPESRVPADRKTA